MIIKTNISARLVMTPRKKTYAIISLTACLILVACNSTLAVDQPVETNHPQSSTLDTIPDISTPEHSPTTITRENTPTSEPPEDRTERIEITHMPEIINPEELPNREPIIGETPVEILEKIFTDLTQRTGVDEQHIQVIRSEAVTWNDGSLGCPKPGEFYTQALIKGYWVILQIAGADFDYRVSDSGAFRLCEGRGRIPISPPGETAPKK